MVFGVLQDMLPELGEGKDGFAPPVLTPAGRRLFLDTPNARRVVCNHLSGVAARLRY